MFYSVQYFANGSKAFVNFGNRYLAACALARRVSRTLDSGVDVVFHADKPNSIYGICCYANGVRVWTDGPMKLPLDTMEAS